MGERTYARCGIDNSDDDDDDGNDDFDISSML